MQDTNTTLSGWQYWIEAPSRLVDDLDDPVIGTLVLHPVVGEDVAIDLEPGHAPGQAAQAELRERIGAVVDEFAEAEEIFDRTSFVLPDLVEARSHTARVA
jgi:hypothetical protein